MAVRPEEVRYGDKMIAAGKGTPVSKRPGKMESSDKKEETADGRKERDDG
jgi:hypothetical protein